MKIGRNTIKRTIKISSACIIAIILAQLLNLQYYTAAGIIAILSIGNSKKETMRTALNRSLAFLCALIISYLFYYTVGLNTLAFFIYIVAFVGVCIYFKWPEAMAMDSVLITHFLSSQSISGELLINEVMLFIIGTGCGIVANIFLRKDNNQFECFAGEVDNEIKSILNRMAERLVNCDKKNYDGSCFLILDEKINAAQKCALQNYNNALISSSDMQMNYIAMRQKQRFVLEEIYKSIVQILNINSDESPRQLFYVTDFILKVNKEYDRDNNCEELLSELDKLLLELEEQELPKTRIEFEARALLFYILKQIREILQLKKEFMEREWLYGGEKIHRDRKR